MKRILLATLAALSVVPIGAKAKTETFEDHRHLWNTLNEIGIVTTVNHPQYCDKGNDGVYFTIRRIVVICQDLATVNDGNEVQWTENDINTLKHEAHHVVQDCSSTPLGDGILTPLFDGEDFDTFVRGAYTPEQLTYIQEDYREMGADDDVIIMEMEAFAAAKTIPSRMIASKLVEFCTE